MAKFNTTATIRTTNKEGHAAYRMQDKEKLVTQVLTSFFNEKKFYGDNSKDMTETIKRVVNADPDFVSRLAVFARRVFNMRSVSHVLVGFLAHEPEGKPYVRKTLDGVILRGDDATEILAFYLATFGKPIPNSLRKGLANKFRTFDEYTLAKYKGEGHTVKMRDVLMLTHPAPKDDEQSAMWKRLLEDKLETPLTWETELSKSGNNKETWERLINSRKVGYMALLRNLRNIIAAKPDNLEAVLNLIKDPVAVRKSKQLPFRFLSAYKNLPASAGSRVYDALESAVEASIENMPRLSGTTVIAVDVSGSMSGLVSSKSDIQCCEIGMLLGLIANKMCDNSIFYTFNNNISKRPMSSRNGILHTTVNEAQANGGTDMRLPFQRMMADKVDADRVIIISDNQCNSGGWYSAPVQVLADRYRNESGNDIWVHAIDLQGYGTQQFHGKKTNIIAGWSEKVFDFIHLAEQGEGTLEKSIATYTW